MDLCIRILVTHVIKQLQKPVLDQALREVTNFCLATIKHIKKDNLGFKTSQLLELAGIYSHMPTQKEIVDCLKRIHTSA